MADTHLYAIRGPQERAPGWYAVDQNGFTLPGSDGPLSEAIAQDVASRYNGSLVRVDAPPRVDTTGMEAS
jgi:hypothetical protein